MRLNRAYIWWKGKAYVYRQSEPDWMGRCFFRDWAGQLWYRGKYWKVRL